MNASELQRVSQEVRQLHSAWITFVHISPRDDIQCRSYRDVVDGLLLRMSAEMEQLSWTTVTWSLVNQTGNPGRSGRLPDRLADAERALRVTLHATKKPLTMIEILEAIDQHSRDLDPLHVRASLAWLWIEKTIEPSA